MKAIAAGDGLRVNVNCVLELVVPSQRWAVYGFPAEIGNFPVESAFDTNEGRSVRSRVSEQFLSSFGFSELSQSI